VHQQFDPVERDDVQEHVRRSELKMIISSRGMNYVETFVLVVTVDDAIRRNVL
jgi:hypothetical protein